MLPLCLNRPRNPSEDCYMGRLYYTPRQHHIRVVNCSSGKGAIGLSCPGHATHHLHAEQGPGGWPAASFGGATRMQRQTGIWPARRLSDLVEAKSGAGTSREHGVRHFRLRRRERPPFGLLQVLYVPGRRVGDAKGVSEDGMRETARVSCMKVVHRRGGGPGRQAPCDAAVARGGGSRRCVVRGVRLANR